MDIREYTEKASRTDAPLSSIREHDIHMILGIVTEAGELADIFKKAIAYKKEIDWVNVKEEVGDIAWYIANLCNTHDIDLEKVLETNIDKLIARYPEKFTEEKANNRHLDVERQVLEFGKKLKEVAKNESE